MTDPLPAEPNGPAQDLPLTGVRVVDAIDGPLRSVARLLADLGADVVALPRRGSTPPTDQALVADEVWDAGKRHGSIDPERDRAGLQQLLASTDLLLTDWDAARRARVGLDDLIAAMPEGRLIDLSITDFGRSGPDANRPASSDVHFAISTNLSRSGLPEVPEPLLPPEFLAFQAAAAQALWVALVALTDRTRNGRGLEIDLSVSESLMHVLDPATGIGGSARAGASLADLPHGRPDARHLYPIFATRDGWVRICVLSARQWAGMFEWLGRPEEFADPAFANTQRRFAAAGTLYPLIGSLLGGLTTDEAVLAGQRLGVPTAGLDSASDALQQPAFRDAGSFTGLTLPDGRQVTVPVGPFVLDGVRAGLRAPDEEAPAPTLGDVHSSGPAVRAFEGLRVLDLGVIVVGAELGRLFADHGADVVKIESSAFPDGARGSGPDDGTMADGFAAGQRNKRSLGLNLRSDEGKRVFADLVRTADVVLTNFRPGTLESLGFGWETLQRLNPRIVLSESSAFGNEGPWSRRLGYGPLVRASAGLSSLWQYPEIDGSFSDAITVYPDHVVGRLNAAAVAALLLRRGRTGNGGRVSTAQVDAIFFAMSDLLALESLHPGSVRAEGNARGTDAPRGVFQADGDDEWVVVDVVGDDRFAALAGAIGHPEWTSQGRLSSAQGRLDHREELLAAVAAWVRDRPSDEAAARLAGAGVPAARMLRPADLLVDPHLAARGALVWMDQPQIGRPLPVTAREAVGLPGPLLAPAPLRAEHTREVLDDWLHLGAARVARLVESGAVEVRRAEPGGAGDR